MKKAASLIFAFVFTFSCCSFLGYNLEKASGKDKNTFYTIVIDAGHGGKDAGAIGFDSSEEKTINLDIATFLYDFLMVSGINSVMTRTGDYETYYDENDDKSRSDLYNRMDLVNSIEKSVLISVHQNHYEDESEHGTQIWYAKSEKSKEIADCILSDVKKYLQSDNKRENKLTTSSYYLLYKAVSPSVMVECGFISNKEENELLQNSAYQKKMAYSVLTGVSEALYSE